jgi:hypothetical protein
MTPFDVASNTRQTLPSASAHLASHGLPGDFVNNVGRFHMRRGERDEVVALQRCQKVVVHLCARLPANLFYPRHVARAQVRNPL